LDASLVTFVDSESGASRSEKLERIVRRYRDVLRDIELRKELAAFNVSEDDIAESDAWRQVMEASLWSESDEATSGPSRSRRSRNRGRR
jgi:hypothetical protein